VAIVAVDAVAIGEIGHIAEPVARLTIYCPQEHIGGVLKLCEDRRGTQVSFDFSAPGRIQLVYDIPYAEVVFDFFDKLKSVSRGYASMDYELEGYRQNSLTRLDMLVNGDRVDALSAIVHKDKAYHLGRELALKLKKIVPRQQYEVAIQAAIGSKIIARETVRALRKDVTAKCYGGDITRKRKLLEKQKEGKKRMKMVGQVEVPQEAFITALRID